MKKLNAVAGIDAKGSLSNPESVFANVTVNRGSSVSYNDTGIHIGRGQEFTSSTGKKRFFNVLEMSCAKMIDNMYGVKGNDIILNILRGKIFFCIIYHKVGS